MSTLARTSTPGWLLVARREIVMKMRDKTILISLALMLVAAAAGFVIPALTSDSDDAVSVAVSAPDAAGIVETAAHAGDTKFEKHQAPSADAVREQVKKGDAKLGLVRNGKDWTILANSHDDSAKAEDLATTVQQAALGSNAQAAGVKVEDLFAHTNPAVEVLEEGADTGLQTYLATLAFAMLFYLMSLFIGTGLASSVVEEKQNRIIEVIASSVRVRDLLIGKVVGGVVVAFVQVLLLCAVAVAGLWFSGQKDLLRTMAPAVGWFLPFFVVGVAVLATLFLAAGALCSRTEDVQSATMPVTMLSMFAFFGGLLVKGSLAKVLVYVPLVSSILVPGQLAGGKLAWWVPLISLAISLAFAALMIAVADRIYRVALLRVGRRTSWKEALAGQR